MCWERWYGWVDTAEASRRGALLHARIGPATAGSGGVDHEVVKAHARDLRGDWCGSHPRLRLDVSKQKKS